MNLSCCCRRTGAVAGVQAQLVITSGKDKGKRLSVASVHRILAEDSAADGTG
ncbi:hypothetical protein [Streptomyces sviceus]|uniref:hypothetical protein n=1 Tax=Streptomyces sviceus TaxID=285530 RepID=UPI0036B23F49